MSEAKELIKELKSLIGNDDPQSKARCDEIALWFDKHKTPENVRLFRQFLGEGLDGVLAEIEDIRRQISDEDYRLLPLSYIASHYFQKSAAWLCQRINGTPVRGKVYTLNAEQKATFNRALREIGQRIGSFQLA